ncbi:glycosyltransferase family 2 protein [Pseudomonas fulva]|uniref:Glycosyl transferase family 2 n=1 Tax=Pseudomonas fulva (strain 12-X) TaxID=743720 RepID=F6AKQ5_PSEF1|nr:glycosyltransferase family 2 protein [Pseudomonas fulva]AEF24129.1 glycosyl transferase family 2 [Pseudomonas fulva 12-X]
MLTVILLTYNHVQTFVQSIESILAQETSFDFDIHVLDDCSIDGTSAICEEYSRAWPGKVKHFRNANNLGVEKNLKDGFLRISSKYIAFLEGDDYWTDRSKLQLQVEMLERHPECTLCGHNVTLRDHALGEDRLFVNIPREQLKAIYQLGDGIPIHPSARVYRNCIDFSEVPAYMVLDTHIYRLFLQRGGCCYLDRVMSVYNKTGVGFWSGMPKRDKRLMTLRLRYASLQYHNFEHEADYYPRSTILVLLKMLLGVRCGWWAFYNLESFRIKLKYKFHQEK